MLRNANGALDEEQVVGEQVVNGSERIACRSRAQNTSFAKTIRVPVGETEQRQVGRWRIGGRSTKETRARILFIEDTSREQRRDSTRLGSINYRRSRWNELRLPKEKAAEKVKERERERERERGETKKDRNDLAISHDQRQPYRGKGTCRDARVHVNISSRARSPVSWIDSTSPLESWDDLSRCERSFAPPLSDDIRERPNVLWLREKLANRNSVGEFDSVLRFVSRCRVFFLQFSTKFPNDFLPHETSSVLNEKCLRSVFWPSGEPWDSTDGGGSSDILRCVFTRTEIKYRRSEVWSTNGGGSMQS